MCPARVLRSAIVLKASRVPSGEVPGRKVEHRCFATFQDLRIGETGTKRLRASSPQQAPIDSNVFEITAGSAVKITVFSGAPQSTTISTDFPAQLQAQVTDIGGNPVRGITVAFSTPSSGPSGSFSGPSAVQPVRMATRLRPS